jgi:hypothetical protein
MAPALTHPPGVSFVDDHGGKPVNVDAATYYGGEEAYSRSRTYSGVRTTSNSRKFIAHPFLRLSPMVIIPNVHLPLGMNGITGHDACRMTRRA